MKTLSKFKKQATLRAEAKKYLVIEKLFPKVRPNFSKSLNAYQVKKINRALKEIKKIGGEYFSDFVPITRGRKKYNKDHGLPEYFRGTFLPGGTKVNSEIHYINGGVYYLRGGQRRARFQLDVMNDTAGVIASAEKILDLLPEKATATVTASGRAVQKIATHGELMPIVPSQEKELVIKNAVAVYEKYVDMAEEGKKRDNGRIAAHPKYWIEGMGILFEDKTKIINGDKNGKGKKLAGV